MRRESLLAAPFALGAGVLAALAPPEPLSSLRLAALGLFAALAAWLVWGGWQRAPVAGLLAVAGLAAMPAHAPLPFHLGVAACALLAVGLGAFDMRPRPSTPLVLLALPALLALLVTLREAAPVEARSPLLLVPASIAVALAGLLLATLRHPRREVLT